MLSESDIVRLGIDKLLEYLCMTKQGLIEFMVSKRIVTIHQLALYLSEDTSICSICSNAYVFILDNGFCDVCRDNFLYEWDK